MRNTNQVKGKFSLNREQDGKGGQFHQIYVHHTCVLRFKVGLTKGSEYPAHPDIPTIALIAGGLFTFILTAGHHHGDDDDVVDDDEDEEDEHHHCPSQPSMVWPVREQGFHQVRLLFIWRFCQTNQTTF